jgi:putative transposase
VLPSIGRKILAIRIARIQAKVARSRQDWQFKMAHKLFEDCDVIFVEDLQLKNLIRRNKVKTDESGKITANGQAAKSGLNKSLTDAALGQFVKILEWVAFKLGKRVIKGHLEKLPDLKKTATETLGISSSMSSNFELIEVP